ncbi:histidine phosphatase family protein [Oenococcus alcoholitolerans]|uniref:histidine phosphatase family protein n=1 Tax=Oenococcus alcoholitolerans TaxID=931074 RepID=UPI003F7232D6
MKATFYLVRHGQTFYNRYNKLQGWSDSPLTENGIQDAVKVGKRLARINFSAAFSSDTSRAIKTARIIIEENNSSKPIELTSLPNLREQFYGSFEGTNMDAAWLSAGAPYGLKNYKEIVDQFGLASTKDFLKSADPWHDAENNDEYWSRFDEGLEKIINSGKIIDGSNVLMISHGNTLLSLADRFGHGEIPIDQRPKNGSVSKLFFSNGDWHFLSFDDHDLA